MGRTCLSLRRAWWAGWVSAVPREARLSVFQTTARIASWRRMSRTVSRKYRQQRAAQWQTKNACLSADGEPALQLIKQITAALV